MNIDKDLCDLWQRQQPPQTLARDLYARVRRHRRARFLRRAVEVALTVAALGLFVWSIRSGSSSPRLWLLMPYFSVFLMVSWTYILRQQAGERTAASESAAVYATVRQLQIRASLSDLVFAERSAIALLIYALAASIGAFLLMDADWRSAVSVLLLYSMVWYVGTRWLVGRKRRGLHREYRAISRIRSDLSLARKRFRGGSY